MKEIKVQIPNGDYCDNCKFLNYYTNRLTDIFGNYTGNIDEGYECKYYNIKLQTEPSKCCCSQNIKKCFMCKIGENEAMLIYALLLKSLDNKDKKEKFE